PNFLSNFTFTFRILITFSMPLVPVLYFLYSSQDGGVRFGMWGWCLDSDGVCQHPIKLGYTWEPEISSPITKAHVFFPIAAFSTLCALLSLVPVLVKRTSKTERIFSYLCLFSFLMSAIPTLFALSIWSVAKDRFLAAGFEAHFGPLPWMALAATFLLMI
ncbi:hypothetical protein BDN72DRAFT_722782, partial [Pluteus cervinus]